MSSASSNTIRASHVQSITFSLIQLAILTFFFFFSTLSRNTQKFCWAANEIENFLVFLFDATWDRTVTQPSFADKVRKTRVPGVSHSILGLFSKEKVWFFILEMRRQVSFWFKEEKWPKLNRSVPRAVDWRFSLANDNSHHFKTLWWDFSRDVDVIDLVSIQFNDETLVLLPDLQFKSLLSRRYPRKYHNSIKSLRSEKTELSLHRQFDKWRKIINFYETSGIRNLLLFQ